jgi:hypothetical protein
MKAYEIISHKGKSIVVVNLSNNAPTETISSLKEAHKRISENPAKSVLLLTEVTNAVYNKDVSSAIQEFSTKNTPFVKKSAVVGVEGLKMVLLRTINLLTRREIKACASRQEALDWLAG